MGPGTSLKASVSEMDSLHHRSEYALPPDFQIQSTLSGARIVVNSRGHDSVTEFDHHRKQKDHMLFNVEIGRRPIWSMDYGVVLP